MKRAVISIIGVILSLVLCTSSSIVFVSASEAQMNASDLQQKELDSINQYNLLLAAFKHEHLNRKTFEDDGEYPDYYAGAYLNDNKELVVLITDSDTRNIEEVREYTKNDDIIIEQKSNPYNELSELQNQIFSTYTQYYEKYENNLSEVNDDLLNVLASFIGVGISQKNNKVIVHLKNIDEQSINAFKKYISSSDIIYFEQRSFVTSDTTYLNSGAYIRANQDGGPGSIGFRCQIYLDNEDYDNKYLKGFFTAGHVTGAMQYTEVFDSAGYKIGDLAAYKYQDNVDAAFVALGTNYEMNASTRVGVALGDNYFTSMAEGSTVNMCGANTSTSGEIVNTSYSFTTESGVALSDVYRCDYSGVGGDSGGVVYSYYN